MDKIFLIIVSVVSSIVGWFKDWNKTLIIEFVKMALTRAWQWFLLTVILPIVLWNFYILVITKMIEFIMAKLPVLSVSEKTINIAGVGGWMAQRFHVPELFAILITCITIKITLRFIKI